MVEASASVGHTHEQEAEELFNLFWTMQALPPGRGLWTGGVEGMPDDARFNCVSGETRFWANGVLRTMAELSGQTVEVRCLDGQWRPAEVRSFGSQRLFDYHFGLPGRSLYRMKVTATAGHRWITSNRGEVTDLRVGDKVRVQPDEVDREHPAYKAGFLHGLVYGDGSATTGRPKHYQIRLCGAKVRFLEALVASEMYASHSYPASFKDDPHVRLRTAVPLKDVPDESETFEYQAGFLDGWLATDGFVQKGATGIEVSDPVGVAWIKERAPLLGYCVTGAHENSTAGTNYGPRKCPPERLTLVRTPVEYQVKEVTDPGRHETVYCVVEPVTKTFTLAGGLPTGNCWFTTLRTTEDWCWVMNQLMLGGGVGVGITAIDQLPGVTDGSPRLSVHCRDTHPNLAEVKPNDKAWLNGSTPVYDVHDSREGWVEAFRRVVRAAWAGTSLIVNVSPVRPRGEPIRTFGGTACGPGPLTHLLRSVWEIIRGAAGRQLTSVECLDVTNLIGFCVKSGNVRRSALITLGNADDRPFRDAKKDWAKVTAFRHTSNNSLAFQTWDQISTFDWADLVQDNLDMGEPGLLNLPLIRQTDAGVTGVNPCFTGDTRIATQFGMVQIADLVKMGQPLRVSADVRVKDDYVVHMDNHTRGVTPRDAVPAFQTSEAAEVYRITTAHGYEVKATAYHKFVTPDGFVELKDLDVGATLLLQSGAGQWGTQGSEALGHVIGWVEGDGNFSAGTDKVYLRFWGAQKNLAETFLPWCREVAATMDPQNGHTERFGVIDQAAVDTVCIASPLLGRALAEVGYREKGRVPEVVWRGTKDCVRGYLRGLFAADGQINWSESKKSFSIRLSQSNPLLLRDVQALLLNFGVVSRVYSRRPAQMKRMPDGKGGQRDYWCKEQFDLVVSSANAVAFRDEIGFLLDTHAAAFTAWAGQLDRGPYQESFTTQIVAIQMIGVEPVYCTTQPMTHTVIANGVVTGQCGEIPLHDREACNLAEVFPALFHENTIGGRVYRLLTRYTLRQKITNLMDPEADHINRKNMRLGVGLGGLCDFEWDESYLEEAYRLVRGEADRYADDFGVNRPIAVTTVKPSGTISLLNGSSPGIHAPWAPFYLRRSRLAKNDPMVPALIDAGVPYETCAYDNTGHTLVFAFPTRARHTNVTVQTQTIRDQFKRQVAVQRAWADNSVSATLSFNPDTEVEETVACLKEYVPYLKSTSLLAQRHAYVQAPYEEIPEAQFRDLYNRINHQHPLVAGGEMEVDDCASGACPVR